MKDISAQVFGRLTAIEHTGVKKNGNAVWRFRCSCGKDIERAAAGVVHGNTTSCGCLRSEISSRVGKTYAKRLKAINMKHGHASTGRPSKTYAAWQNMRRRCNDPASKDYPRYGGRGIKVCERWKSFENFLADMGECPPDRQIDREDNDGDYEPANCTWSTPVANSNNKANNRLLSCRGKIQTLAQWAAEMGLNEQTISHRIKAGWAIEDALERPSNRSNRGVI